MYFKRKQFERVLVMLVDLSCIVVSVLAAHWLRYEDVLSRQNLPFILILFIGMYLFVVVLFGMGEDFFARGLLEELTQVVKLHVILLALTTAYLYISKRTDDVSRLVAGYFHIIDICLMWGLRSLLKRYLFRYFQKGRSSRQLLLVTDTKQAERVVAELKNRLSWDMRLAGVVLVDHEMDGFPSSVGEIPVVADMGTLIDYVRLNPVDEVFVRVDRRVPVSMKRLVRNLASMGITVDLSILMVELDVPAEKSLNQLADFQVVTFSRKMLSYNQMLMKRMLDIVGALAGMVLFGLAYLVFGPIIKLGSPGPVLFRQSRVGKNGRVFQIYKFRSMYRDAEQRKKELMRFNQMNGLMFKMEDDPRITRIGRFLRKTSIDELPQFWNVLKGDMSLVGTRPPTLDEFEQYKPEYKTRLILPPGLTGLWQVSGRSGITDFDEVMKLDMKYIDNWTFLGDIKLLFRTVGVVLWGRGAK